MCELLASTLSILDSVEKSLNHVSEHVKKILWRLVPRLVPWMDSFSSSDIDEIFRNVEHMKTPHMSLRQSFAHFHVGEAGMPRNKHLKKRQKKVMKIGLKKVGARTTPRSQVVVDLANSWQRSLAGFGHTPGFVANSAMFWSNQNRLLSGVSIDADRQRLFFDDEQIFLANFPFQTT